MNPYGIAIDIDWAPDFMIDFMAAELLLHQIKASWYVTHLSPAVERFRRSDLFELGIHPNFRPGSSHGNSPREVLKTVMDMVPEAISVRTHGLIQSADLYEIILN